MGPAGVAQLTTVSDSVDVPYKQAVLRPQALTESVSLVSCHTVGMKEWLNQRSAWQFALIFGSCFVPMAVLSGAGAAAVANWGRPIHLTAVLISAGTFAVVYTITYSWRRQRKLSREGKRFDM